MLGIELLTLIKKDRLALNYKANLTFIPILNQMRSHAYN